MKRTLRIYESAYGPRHPIVAESLNHLAVLHVDIGAHDHALRLLERAHRIQEEALGPAHPALANLLNSIATAHLSRGDFAASISPLKRSFADTLEARSSTAGTTCSAKPPGVILLICRYPTRREVDWAKPQSRDPRKGHGKHGDPS